MIILDNNALSYMRKSRQVPTSACVITPDIQEEHEAAYDRPLPKNIQIFTKAGQYGEGEYLRQYKMVLNKYRASFYAMRGFGDISIIALLHTIRLSQADVLPGLGEEVRVVTSDAKLKKRISREFPAGMAPYLKVTVVPEDEFFK